jgi:probable HAF family extracellular repeat protein
MAAAFASDEGDGLGAGSGTGFGAGTSAIHPDPSSAAIVVPDAQLLFSAHFGRSGPDLVLTAVDGHRYIVPGYFSSEHPPALVAPNGASLSAEVIGLMAGSPVPGEYAQTQPATPPAVIGKVEKLVGTATVIRNGASVTLNAGDVVYKSDVVETGPDSKVGIGFPDGTALELLANTRMALNEYSYDGSGHANSALFTYVEGTFGFFAGKVAHTGDMKIATPIATMGIRGTTGVMGQGTDSSGHAFYWQSIYDDPGTRNSGSWDDFGQNADGTTFVEITVSQPGEMTVFTLQGPGLPPIITTVPLPASYNLIALQIIEDLTEIINLLNATPHSTPGSVGSPENPFEVLPQEYLPEPGNGPQLIFYVPIAPPGGGPPVIVPIIETPPSGGTQTGFIWPAGAGTWDTAAGWLGDQVPIAAIDTVTIESGTVQYGSSGTDNYPIGELIIDSPAQLDITSGTLNVQDELDDGGVLVVGGGDPPSLTVNGTLTVEAAAKMIARGRGSVIDVTLATVDNSGTIAARHRGDIEFVADASVTNEAAGKIKSVGSGSVVDFTAVPEFDNAGLVLAKHGGGVFFVDSSVTNEGSGLAEPRGVIAAIDCGSTVTFETADLFNYGIVVAEYGGIVRFDDASVVNEPGGVVWAAAGGTIRFKDSAVTNDSRIVARDGGGIFFTGADTDVINEDGASIVAIGCDSEVAFRGDEIGNFGTMSARYGGTLRFDDERVANASGAKIDATYCGVVAFGSDCAVTNDGGLIVARQGGLVAFDDVTVRNKSGGVIEAGRHGTVVIADTTVKNAGGTIEAIGACAVVTLVDATIKGGTLTTGSPFCGFGGVIEVVAACGNHVTTFDGSDHKVINDGFVQVGPGANLELVGTIVNDGRIDIDEEFFGADLLIDGTVTLKGGGVVTLDGKGDDILAAAHGAELDNDSAIVGAGRIGDRSLTLVNERSGIIDADLRCETLVLDTGAGVGNAIVNDGKLEATDGGILKIKSDVENDGGTIKASSWSTVVIDDVTVNNTDLGANDGMIAALGCFATIELMSATIIGGIVKTSDGGIIENPSGTSTFEHVTIANGTVIQTDDGTKIDLKGKTTLDGTVTFEGGGKFNLDGGKIVGDAPAKLENFGTITGDGEIIGTHDAPLTLINESIGKIVATGGLADPLVIDTGCNVVTNAGMLEATGGSELGLYGTINNAGGTIAALSHCIISSPALVQLFGATIEGGTLKTDSPTSGSDSMIEVIAGDGSTFDGSGQKVTVDGYVQVDNGADLAFAGTIDDLGTINVDGTSGADLAIDGTVKLKGDGDVILDDHGDQIVSGSDSATLKNFSNISGEGTIGDESLTLVNETPGVIDADGAKPLILDTGATIENKGTLEATNGATLDVQSDVNNSSTGLLEATGTGSTLKFEAVRVSHGEILVEAGNTLEIENGQTVFSHVDVENSGHLKVDDSDVTATLVVDNGTTLDGTVDVGSTGELDVDGATLDGATINDNGTVNFDGPVTLAGDLTVNLENGGTFDDTGTITVAGGDSATLAGVNVDTVDIASNATLTLHNADADVVDFIGSDGTLKLDTPANAPGLIEGLTVGDAIDLAGITVTNAVIDSAGTELTVTKHNGSTLTYDISGASLTQDYFTIDVVSNNGNPVSELTLTAVPAPTFTSGTTANVDEGVPAGTVVFTAAATDSAGLPITYSLTGTDAADFNINASGVVSIEVVPDASTKNTYDFGVEAGDAPGVSATQNVALTVNDLPPSAGTATVTGGVEGVTPANLSAKFSTPDTSAPASDFSGTIDWGDGSVTAFDSSAISGGNGSFTVSGSHQYAEEGNYTAVVTINDGDGGSTTDAGTAMVADAPLTGSNEANVSATEGLPAQLVNATFTDANPGDHSGDFTASINWGDNTTSAGIITYNNGVYSVAGSHTYAQPGSDPIAVTVTDAGGQTATIDGTATVADAPLTPSATAVSGTEFTSTGTVEVATFTDGDPLMTSGDFTATINWGDGTAVQNGTIVADPNGGFDVDGAHTYGAAGNCSITVNIDDTNDGNTANVVSSATIAIAPPVVTTPAITSNDLAGPNAVHNGDVLTASATGHPDDTITYQWFSSADNDTTVVGTGATYSVQAGDIGNALEVIATSTNDITGAFVTAESTVNVTPAPPNILAGDSVTFTGGGSPVVIDGNLSITDPSSQTLVSATVSIGTGFVAGEDTLAFNGGAGSEALSDGAIIDGSYDSATGILTLTEDVNSTTTPILGDFQTALRSVTFSDGNSDPTDGGGDTSRTIDWSVNDGTQPSNTATSTVDTVHVAPTVTSGAFAEFRGGGSAVVLDSNLTVTDNNSDPGHISAQVQILGANSGDTLTFNNGADTQTFGDGATIAASYNNANHILTLSEANGSTVAPSIADFQTALQSVAYSFTPSDDDPTAGGNTTKTILWAVDDGNTVNGSNQVYPTPAGELVSDDQPSLGLNQVVVEQGSFPGTTDGLPIGTIRTLAGGTVPDGTAEANGAVLPIPTNQALFSILGPNYGGDGEHNFGLPNLQGTLAVGQDGNANTNLGEQFGSDDALAESPFNLPFGVGGFGGPIDNDQPSQTVNYLINVGGSASSSGTDMLGEVVPYLGSSAPSGYMLAEGQILNISQYQSLYNVIGDTYGGNGVTTFALPDLTGRTIVGAGQYFDDVQLGVASGQDTTTLSSGFPGQFTANNQQPSLALNYIIDADAAGSLLPSTSTTPTATQPVIGEIIAYAGPVADIPTGWMLADGSELSALQYNLLYQVIGTTYGSGGSGTFDLPDLVGRAVAGTGFDFSQSVSLGEQYGSGTMTVDFPQWALPTVSTSTLVVVHTAPTVSAGATADYSSGSTTPVVLDNTAAASDGDSGGNLTGATIEITGGFRSGDTLAFDTSGTNIHASYDSSTATLTLTGTDTIQDYNTVLDSVTYVSTAVDPTNGGADSSRTITWQVNDNATTNNLSNAATSTVELLPPPTEPFIWATNAGGNWTDLANWNDNDSYPGQHNADQVEIQPTNDIVVAYDTTETIDSLVTNGDATLDITGGTLTITSNTAKLLGPVENAGTLQLTNGTVDLVANSGNFDVVGDNTVLLTGDVNNDGGTIAAYDGGNTTTGSTIQLATITIAGGFLDIGDSAAGDTDDALLVNGGAAAVLTGATVTDDGVINISGGSLTVDSASTISGSGSVDIGAGGTADFQNGFDQNVTFTGDGVLALGQPSSFDSNHAISDFAYGDAIDLTGFAYSQDPATEFFTWTQGVGSGTLTLTDGAMITSLTLDGTYGNNFTLEQDASGGTDIVYSEPGFSYSTWDYPAAVNQVPSNDTVDVGINNAGQIIGNYYDSQDVSHAFLSTGVNFTLLFDPDVPGSSYYYASAINNSGEVAGDFYSGSAYDSFIYNSDDGSYDTLTGPVGTDGTIADGINDAGQVTGYSYVAVPGASNSWSYQGFVYSGSANGTYTTLNDSNAGSGSDQGTVPIAMNNSGEVVGYYYDSNGAYHGFLYDNGGFTELDYPAVGNASVQTAPYAINNAGEVVGYFYNGSNYEGFIYSGGASGSWTPLDVPGATNTYAYAINNEGQVLGDYSDANGSHGFIYSNGTYTTLDFPNGLAAGTDAYSFNDAGEVVGSYAEQISLGNFVSFATFGFVADPYASVPIPVGATLTLTTASLDYVQFEGNTGALDLDQSLAFSGSIGGFGGGDLLNLNDLSYSPSDYALWTQDATGSDAYGALAIYQGDTLQEYFYLYGTYAPLSFALSDNSGAVQVALAATGPDEWTNASGGAWITSSNWSDGVPSPTTNADLDDAVTVTLSSDAAVNILATAPGSVLAIDSGAILTVTTAIDNAGTIDFDSTGGTISGGAIVDQDLIDVIAPGTIDANVIGGQITIESGATLTVNGTLNLQNLDDEGTLAANGGTLTVDSGTSIFGAGSVLIANGGTADFQGAFDQNVTFGSGGGTLELAQAASFDTSHVIAAASGSFASNDVLDLFGFAITDHASVGSFNSTADTTTLTIYDSSSDVVQTFTLAGDQSGTAWTVEADASNTGIDVYDPPATDTSTDATLTVEAHPIPAADIVVAPGSPILIAAGATLNLFGPSSQLVAFAAGTGGLVLNDPGDFTGHIDGFTGTAPDAAHSDTIDLVGINYDSSLFAETYNSTTGLLSVTDGTHSASITFNDFNATLDFASDGNGGTLITDPPAAGASGAAPTADPQPAAADADGSLTVADNHGAGVETASFTPGGSDFAGHFSLGAVTQNNGAASVEFDFHSNQIDLAPGQTLTQSHNVTVADAQNPAVPQNQTVSVTVGGPGNDHFVFAPGIGADTLVNFNPQHDTIELAHFANIQTTQQLVAAITPGVHGDAVINLGHHDSIAIPGMTAADLHAVLQTAVHLH